MRALMTQKSCALRMRNAILRNYLKLSARAPGLLIDVHACLSVHLLGAMLLLKQSFGELADQSTLLFGYFTFYFPMVSRIQLPQHFCTSALDCVQQLLQLQLQFQLLQLVHLSRSFKRFKHIPIKSLSNRQLR